MGLLQFRPLNDSISRQYDARTMLFLIDAHTRKREAFCFRYLDTHKLIERLYNIQSISPPQQGDVT